MMYFLAPEAWGIAAGSIRSLWATGLLVRNLRPRNFGRTNVGRNRPVQRLHELQQVVALLTGQKIERVDFLIEVRIRIARPNVEIHHLLHEIGSAPSRES